MQSVSNFVCKNVLLSSVTPFNHTKNFLNMTKSVAQYKFNQKFKKIEKISNKWFWIWNDFPLGRLSVSYWWYWQWDWWYLTPFAKSIQLVGSNILPQCFIMVFNGKALSVLMVLTVLTVVLVDTWHYPIYNWKHTHTHSPFQLVIILW